jgi:hypothetical protein
MQPQRGELVVRVRAVSLNFRDVAMLRNQYPLPHKRGLIPTSDAAGEVVEVGEQVDSFKVGDRVMGTFHPRWFGGRPGPDLFKYGYGSEIDGWLVERKVVSQESVVRVPDNLSFEEAATLPCAGLTAWVALTAGMVIRAGDTVLTQGTGGVSIFALQLAKAVGARVISTTFRLGEGGPTAGARGGRGCELQRGAAMGRARASPHGRARRGPGRRSGRAGDDGAVLARRRTRRRDRLHRLPEHGKPRHRFLWLFGDFRGISILIGGHPVSFKAHRHLVRRDFEGDRMRVGAWCGARSPSDGLGGLI